MKVVWGSSFDTANSYRAYEKKARQNANDQTGVVSNAMFSKDSAMAQKAEMKLREAEDKLLEELRSQIMTIEASDDDDKVKRIKISTVTEQIKQIEEARAQRERDAAAREIEKQKAEAEKRKEETGNKSSDTEEAPENGISREAAEGMVKLSVSYESLKELSRSKSMLKSEATQLEVDIDNDFGVTKYGRVPTGHMTPGDFKHRQLNKLNNGISGIDQAMAAEIRKLANISEDLATENSKKPDQDQNTENQIDENQNTGV